MVASLNDFVAALSISAPLIGQLIVNLAGVAAGLLLGFRLERKLESRRKEASAISILSAIRDEISHNVDLLKQLGREWQTTPGWVPYYNVEMSVWEATTDKSLDAIENYALLKSISALYQGSTMMSTKINLMLQTAFGVARFSQDYPRVHADLRSSILKQSVSLEQDSTRVIQDIDAELKKIGAK